MPTTDLEMSELTPSFLIKLLVNGNQNHRLLQTNMFWDRNSNEEGIPNQSYVWNTSKRQSPRTSEILGEGMEAKC